MDNCISILLKKDYIALRIKDEAIHEDFIKELKDKLPDLKRFYRDDKTPILVTGKILKADEIEEVEKMIKKVLDVEVDFDSPKDMGLHGIKKDFRKEIESSTTKFVTQSLRSGQKIEFEGSVVVLGDVSDGAEIIAEDNIVVLGKLKGMAHAGAKGNEEAIIAAHLIDSVQIRIGSKIRERTREEIKTQVFKLAYVSGEHEIVLE